MFALRRLCNTKTASSLLRRHASTGTVLDAIASRQFNDAKMQEMLHPSTWDRFFESRINGDDLSKDDQNEIADAMMKFATDNGCVNFSHIFYPVRASGTGLGGTGAYKHDGFVDLDFGSDNTLKPITTGFGATRLFVGESDGSSFPNGGLRATHTAAAFTSWDRNSPPWIQGSTLFIPTVFVTHYGDAIDEKTPLLRSNDAINREGKRLLKHLGYHGDCRQVVSNVGCEQEFFCVDRYAYNRRPDLMAAGRTVLGAAPPRGQQSDVNYFGSINPRVSAMLDDFQAEMWKMGVSNIVMHNEVAPAQHEFSPIFALTNVAADQNVLAQDTLNRVCIDHGLACLFHEKPFKDLNGSGKHNNWGLNTDTGANLFVPGKTTEAQQSFMAMVACLSHAIHKHGDILRVGVASASNDHRLGAQEAPPAIISLGAGKNMEAHIDSIIAGGALEGYGAGSSDLSTGASGCVTIPAGVEDRNRTAPFPFCGNRFEFRAVGSSQNIAFPLALLNTAIAEGMSILSSKIEGGASVRDAVADMFKENRNAIFSGDNYSEDWNGPGGEAEKRGLLNLRTTVDAVDTFTSDKNVKLFSDMKVMRENEVHARQEIMYEAYTNQTLIEANVATEMVDKGVLPAAARTLGAFSGDASALAGDRPVAFKALADENAALKAAVLAVPEDAAGSARYSVDVLKPQLDKLRAAHDAAEVLIDAAEYPYPNYQELLYSHQSERPE